MARNKKSNSKYYIVNDEILYPFGGQCAGVANKKIVEEIRTAKTDKVTGERIIANELTDAMAEFLMAKPEYKDLIKASRASGKADETAETETDENGADETDENATDENKIEN